MPPKGRRGFKNSFQSRNEVTATSTSSSATGTLGMGFDSLGSFYTTKENGVTTLHLWAQSGVNTDPTTCSHCSELESNHSSIPLSSTAPSLESGSLVEAKSTTATGAGVSTTHTEHRCARQDVGRERELYGLVERLMKGDGSFRYQGIEIPMTTEALTSIISGQLENWRQEAKGIWELSRSPAWNDIRGPSAIEEFVNKILQGATPKVKLDNLIIKYVLADIPLDDPLGQKLEERLLTSQAKAIQNKRRARQLEALAEQRQGRYSRFVDETGFKLGTNSGRAFIKR